MDMRILAKIRSKFHGDLYAALNRTGDSILEETRQLASRMQSQEDTVNFRLQEQEERICFRLQEQEEKIHVKLQEQEGRLDEQNRIIQKLQEQIGQLSAESRSHSEQLLKNGAAAEGVNAMVCQMNDSVISLLNSMMPYFPLFRSNGEETVANVNSIFSFCLNEVIRRQTNIEQTDIYQYYKKLHHLTALWKITDPMVQKCRVGRAHDGGYVMIQPFSSRKIAYSIGICDDVSWDKEMAEYGYEIYQYDHTIESLPEENEAFHWKKTGLTGLAETEELKNLATIIQENGHETCAGMLLKMDIEGYEWDLLRTCSQDILNQFDQIVMEIHWLNDCCAYEKILAGLENLTRSHAVVHVHGNNFRYAAFCGDMITPDVMEITLVKKDLYHMEAADRSCTEEIDQVNRANSQDIWTGIW